MGWDELVGKVRRRRPSREGRRGCRMSRGRKAVGQAGEGKQGRGLRGIGLAREACRGLTINIHNSIKLRIRLRPRCDHLKPAGRALD